MAVMVAFFAHLEWGVKSCRHFGGILPSFC